VPSPGKFFNRLLTSGSHHIRKADARNRRAVGLEGGGMTISRYQKRAQANFKPERGGQDHRQHGFSDSHEFSRRTICFHGSTVILPWLKVLIEKIYGFIDANDGS
jgi:hypothetical protein